TEEEQRKTVQLIVRYVRFFPWYFMISTVFVFITAAFAQAEAFGWSRITLVLSLITLGLQMFLYVYFKICRTYFKYVFFYPKMQENKPEMFRKNTKDLFEKYAPENHKRKKNILEKITAELSDNEQYIRFMRFAGIFSLACILLANIFFSVATNINPITIILLYIILFYSMTIITFKHVLYYHRSEDNIKLKRLFKYGIPSMVIIVILLSSYLAGLPNDLHQLQPVERKEVPVTYESYLDNLLNSSESNNKNYFFVGSYGGGLKANLWNLLLFQELEKISERKFFDRTIVLSGVSGGAVGIGNFSSILLNSKNNAEVSKRIDKIGYSNVLSNELTYLLGKDLFREYLPFVSHKGTDRSFKSMQLHARHTGMKDKLYNNVAYSDYWNKIYKARNNKFPVLLMNTTSVDGLHGVATTVDFPPKAFPGAEIISDLILRARVIGSKNRLDSTLTYFGAVSTTNRFPLFSPTAKIKRKGAFLDGGYFENSGMLSALEAYDAIATIKSSADKKYYDRIDPVFVNIINSKDYYIRQKLNQWGFQKVDLSDGGEIGSIVSTVASIDKLPNYVSAKIEARGFDLINVMMPHKISYSEVQSLLKSKVDDPIRLMEKIEQNNDTINLALDQYSGYELNKWGVVQPPLARLLSKPAVEYQKAMVNYHPDLKKTLGKIKDYLEAKIEDEPAAVDELIVEQIQEAKYEVDVESETVQKGEKLIKKGKKLDTLRSNMLLTPKQKQ
ncbi:MAG: hypothetical protein HKN48_11050, partial [Flavobacteriaceae bacterium]|nr:hypothetical protein [Flavobacteriaceae bacterium]